MSTSNAGPSRLLYVIAALFALGAMFGPAALQIGGGIARERQLVTFEGPGSVVYDANKPGTHYAYYWPATDSSDWSARADAEDAAREDLRIDVRRTSDGTPLTVHALFDVDDIESMNTFGYIVAEFEVDTPGTYEVTATLPEDAPALELAVGHAQFSSYVRDFFLGMGLQFVLYIAAAVFFFATIIGRQRARKAAANRP